VKRGAKIRVAESHTNKKRLLCKREKKKKGRKKRAVQGTAIKQKWLTL
jgi:hypothetical protein